MEQKTPRPMPEQTDQPLLTASEIEQELSCRTNDRGALDKYPVQVLWFNVANIAMYLCGNSSHLPAHPPQVDHQVQ